LPRREGEQLNRRTRKAQVLAYEDEGKGVHVWVPSLPCRPGEGSHHVSPPEGKEETVAQSGKKGREGPSIVREEKN